MWMSIKVKEGCHHYVPPIFAIPGHAINNSFKNFIFFFMGILSSNDAWMFKTKPLFKFRSIPYLNILKGHLYGFSLSVLIKEFHNFPNLKLVATSGRYSSKCIDGSSLLSSTWFQSVSGMHNAAPMNDGKKQLGFQTAVIKITQYLDVPIIKSTSLSTLGSPNVQCKI